MYSAVWVILSEYTSEINKSSCLFVLIHVGNLSNSAKMCQVVTFFFYSQQQQYEY